MESVTELYVQKDENEYYVLITDMGEFQKVYIADHPLMDEYKRIIHLPNDEFKHEIDTFEASAISDSSDRFLSFAFSACPTVSRSLILYNP